MDRSNKILWVSQGRLAGRHRPQDPRRRRQGRRRAHGRGRTGTVEHRPPPRRLLAPDAALGRTARTRSRCATTLQPDRLAVASSATGGDHRAVKGRILAASRRGGSADGRRDSLGGVHAEKARRTRRATPRTRPTPRTSTATAAWTSRPTTATRQTFSVFLRQPGGGFAEEARLAVPERRRATARSATSTATGYPDFASAASRRGRRGPDPQSAAAASRARRRRRSAASRARSATGDFNGDGRADMAVAQLGYATRSRSCCATPPNNGFDVSANNADRRQAARRSPSPTSTATAASTSRSPTTASAQRDDPAAATATARFGAGGPPRHVGGAARPGSPPATSTATAGPTSRWRTRPPAPSSVLVRNAANNGFAAGLGSPIAVGAWPLQVATRPTSTATAAWTSPSPPRSGLDVLLRSGAGLRRDTPTRSTGRPERRRRRRLQRRRRPRRRRLAR